MDASPLQLYRNYRLLFASGTISLLGSYITVVAVPLQVKQLTGSYVLVGLIGAVELGPMLLFGLIGGAIADARDRRPGRRAPTSGGGIGDDRPAGQRGRDRGTGGGRGAGGLEPAGGVCD
jgi:MFS family permease